MTRRINRKNQLPDWFCLDDYEKLLSLSDDEIIFQLIERRDSFNNCKEVHYEEVIEYYFSQGVVKERDKYFYSFTDREFVKRYSELQLHGKGGIEPLSIITVTHLHEKSQKYIEENNIKRSLRGQKRSISSVLEYGSEMYLGINLDWPDELIVKDLMQLLPLWRDGLSKINESQFSTLQSWEVVKRKIFDYNIFPMIDLLTWAGWSGKTITKAVLAVSLFPDGRYDYTNITQTINPFIDNLMKDFSLEKYRREIINKK